MNPPIATMYELRDTLIAALPLYALFGRVPYEPSKFRLTVLAGGREREVLIHASCDGATLRVTATVAPYGRVLEASGTDTVQVAQELAGAIADLLLSRTQQVNFQVKVDKRGRR